ncbi:hypothetical protein R84B8_01186 [Treponema sp. R8-4-B8]
MPTNLSLEQAIAWISVNGTNNSEYVVTLRENNALSGISLNFSGKKITIKLQGIGEERIVLLNSNTALFSINRDVTLILDNMVTLKGLSTNTDNEVIKVIGGTLIMNDGSKICDNSGGGVLVTSSTGTVTSGKFIMNGGEISGHITTSSGFYGIGVCIEYGDFIMEGGEIKNNFGGYGAGVAIYSRGNSTFTMNGGSINNNKAYWGGGVCVYNPLGEVKAEFIMTGSAEICNNEAGGGGGVHIGRLGAGSGGENCFFNMNGGAIFNNTTTRGTGDYGGGGGVRVGRGGIFYKSNTGNAVIYGGNATSELSNKSPNMTSGNAVFGYNKNGSSIKRDWTAQSYVLLDSSVNGNEGGWD